MGNYNVGEIWWTLFPFEECDEVKHRPAIVIDAQSIAILTMMVTSKEKDNPYCVAITDWQEAGLPKESWARIDRIVEMDEWRMDEKIGDLSERDRLKFMQLVVEVQSNKTHDFSLIAIKNPEGKYLQVYDKRWQCWLFPYERSIDPNKETVDKYVSSIIGEAVITSYVSVTNHCKYSVSDKCYKVYKHKLYQLNIDEVPQHMMDSVFEYEGVNYSWMSYEELEKDANTMEKNDDIIAFVKSKVR